MHPGIELLENDIPADPPEGFRLLPTGRGFNILFGPVYGHMKDGKLTLGIRVSRRHINPHQTCHGGVLATFADFQAYVGQQEAQARHKVTPTVSLSIDFLSPAVLGEWLEAKTELLRATRTMLFMQSLASVGNRPVFRSSGVYKIGRPAENEGSTLGDFFESSEEIAT